MIPGAVSISLGGNLLLFLVFFFLLVGLAFLFYRYTLPPLPPSRRIILSLLRSLTLSLLLMVLFEPVFRMISTHEQPPVVAVLIDDSQSMTIKGTAGDRTAAVKLFLGSTHLNVAPAEARYVPFAGQLQTALQPVADSLRFAGETTNLSRAFADIKAQLTQENIQAVVLLTDGNYTEGKNPVYDADELNVPVYTIGVGDTTEQKDILVERVLTNNLAYAETRIPVDVTIKSSGYGGENVEVILSEGANVLDKKILQLRSGTVEYPMSLTLETKEEGTRKYTVSVTHLGGELTDRNNTKSFFIKVLKSKLNIVLFAGAPSPDVSAVRQSFVEDRQLNVKAFVQKSANEFYEHAPTQSALDSADCIVMVGFPSSATSTNLLQQLRTAIETKKKPVLYIHGTSVNYNKLLMLEPVLPITWSGENSPEVLVFPSVIDKYKTNPLITLEGNGSAERWQMLPPLFKQQTTFRTKPEAEMLASVKLQNIVLNEPFLAIRNINRQKSFALTTYGVWRWRLLTQGSSGIEQFLPLFLSNTVRWLTTKEDDKNVRVTPVKETFTTAEAIEFTGQVYDDQLRAVDDAEIIVEMESGGEKVSLALNAIGHGRYEGTISGVREGDYTFTAKATGAGKYYGTDKGKFSVGQMNVEYLETKMNRQLLEQIAHRTGGKFYMLGATGDLAKDIAGVKLTPKEVVQAGEIELWNWKYVAVAIIALFAIEWFLRKRSGMI
jgi:hypothetical protein